MKGSNTMKYFNNFNEMYNINNTNQTLSVFNTIDADNDEEYENFIDFENEVREQFEYRADELLDDIIAEVGASYGIELEGGETAYTSITVNVDLEFDLDNFNYVGNE